MNKLRQIVACILGAFAVVSVNTDNAPLMLALALVALAVYPWRNR